MSDSPVPQPAVANRAPAHQDGDAFAGPAEGFAGPADGDASAHTRSDVVGTAIIRLGIVLFAVGLVSIIISFAAPVFDARVSDYFYIAAMACPLGMVVGVVGALVSGRRRADTPHARP